MYLITNKAKKTRLIIKNKLFKSVFFQSRIIPDEPKLISFGDNLMVAPNVTFVTHNVIDKVLNNMDYNFGFNYNYAPIKVGNNVFIECNVTILPNVKIGNNVIVAAGSVVTKDIENGCVVGGNPAKKIGTFDEYVNERKKDNELKHIWDKFNDEKKLK